MNFHSDSNQVDGRSSPNIQEIGVEETDRLSDIGCHLPQEPYHLACPWHSHERCAVPNKKVNIVKLLKNAMYDDTQQKSTLKREEIIGFPMHNEVAHDFLVVEGLLSSTSFRAAAQIILVDYRQHS